VEAVAVLTQAQAAAEQVVFVQLSQQQVEAVH
jgi:hypothetical protein